MRSLLRRAVILVQWVLLRLSFAVAALGHTRMRRVAWVVGTDEVAGVLHNVAVALPGSFCVSLSEHRFYDHVNDFQLKPGRFRLLRRVLLGPWLLGRLARRSEQFFYIWHQGFLLDRGAEFRFLKAHGKKIAVMFCGDDIRSPELQRARMSDVGRDTFANYDFYLNPTGGAAVYEQAKRAVARDAMENASVVFNAPNDQASYLPEDSGIVEPMHGFVSLAPEMFVADLAKFDEPGSLVIVHAPTSMSVKGTLLVRAAIDRLRRERRDFTYVELLGVSHRRVVDVLRDAHICANQFLSLAPGVLGIEALAAGCAVLMSADPGLEPSLPAFDFSDEPAWLVTNTWAIYDNLKALLDDRALCRRIAGSGFRYAEKHYSRAAAANRLHCALRSHGFEIDPSLPVRTT